jgi:hypothetical protein
LLFVKFIIVIIIIVIILILYLTLRVSISINAQDLKPFFSIIQYSLLNLINFSESLIVYTMHNLNPNNRDVLHGVGTSASSQSSD